MATRPDLQTLDATAFSALVAAGPANYTEGMFFPISEGSYRYWRKSATSASQAAVQANTDDIAVLNTTLVGKADQSVVDTINTQLPTYAEKTALAALQTQVDNLPVGVNVISSNYDEPTRTLTLTLSDLNVIQQVFPAAAAEQDIVALAAVDADRLRLDALEALPHNQIAINQADIVSINAALLTKVDQATYDVMVAANATDTELEDVRDKLTDELFAGMTFDPVTRIATISYNGKPSTTHAWGAIDSTKDDAQDALIAANTAAQVLQSAKQNTHETNAPVHVLAGGNALDFYQRTPDGTGYRWSPITINSSNVVSGFGLPTVDAAAVAISGPNYYYQQLDAPLGQNDWWGPTTADGTFPAQADGKSADPETMLETDFGDVVEEIKPKSPTAKMLDDRYKPDITVDTQLVATTMPVKAGQVIQVGQDGNIFGVFRNTSSGTLMASSGNLTNVALFVPYFKMRGVSIRNDGDSPLENSTNKWFAADAMGAVPTPIRETDYFYEGVNSLTRAEWDAADDATRQASTTTWYFWSAYPNSAGDGFIYVREGGGVSTSDAAAPYDPNKDYAAGEQFLIQTGSNAFGPYVDGQTVPVTVPSNTFVNAFFILARTAAQTPTATFAIGTEVALMNVVGVPETKGADTRAIIGTSSIVRLTSFDRADHRIVHTPWQTGTSLTVKDLAPDHILIIEPTVGPVAVGAGTVAADYVHDMEDSEWVFWKDTAGYLNIQKLDSSSVLMKGATVEHVFGESDQEFTENNTWQAVRNLNGVITKTGKADFKAMLQIYIKDSRDTTSDQRARLVVDGVSVDYFREYKSQNSDSNGQNRYHLEKQGLDVVAGQTYQVEIFAQVGASGGLSISADSVNVMRTWLTYTPTLVSGDKFTLTDDLVVVEPVAYGTVKTSGVYANPTGGAQTIPMPIVSGQLRGMVAEGNGLKALVGGEYDLTAFFSGRALDSFGGEDQFDIQVNGNDVNIPFNMQIQTGNEAGGVSGTGFVTLAANDIVTVRYNVSDTNFVVSGYLKAILTGSTVKKFDPGVIEVEQGVTGGVYWQKIGDRLTMSGNGVTSANYQTINFPHDFADTQYTPTGNSRSSNTVAVESIKFGTNLNVGSMTVIGMFTNSAQTNVNAGVNFSWRVEGTAAVPAGN